MPDGDKTAKMPVADSEPPGRTRLASRPTGAVVSDLGDRRPIRSRGSAWAITVAKTLADLGVTPNQVSVGGTAAAIVAAFALAFGTQETWTGRLLFVLAAVMIEMRLLANLFDGMIAVELGKSSAIGKLYNEIPDRVSDGAIFFAAGYQAGATVDLGLAAACVSLFVAYMRVASRAAGAPADFRGPMAKQHRMTLMIVLCIFLALAPSTWDFEWGPSGDWGLTAIALWAVIVGGLATSARRLVGAGKFLSSQG